MSEHSEIEALRLEIRRLTEQRFFKDTASTKRFMFFQFLRGIAFGLGTVLGGSIVLSFIGFLLAQVDFIPILGDYAAEIARQIEAEVEQ